MEKSIQVQNLKCGGCAATIKKKIEKIEGIQKTEIDVASSTISFEAEKEAQIELVKETLFQIGYPTVDSENTRTAKVKSYVSCAIGKIQS